MIPFREGSAYDADLVFQARRNLYGMEVFSNVAVTEELDAQPDSVIPVSDHGRRGRHSPIPRGRRLEHGRLRQRGSQLDQPEFLRRRTPTSVPRTALEHPELPAQLDALPRCRHRSVRALQLVALGPVLPAPSLLAAHHLSPPMCSGSGRVCPTSLSARAWASIFPSPGEARQGRCADDLLSANDREAGRGGYLLLLQLPGMRLRGHRGAPAQQLAVARRESASRTRRSGRASVRAMRDTR